MPSYCLYPLRNLLVCTKFPIWIVWKSLTPFITLLKCFCVCVFERATEREPCVLWVWEQEQRSVWLVCVCFCRQSVVWPVLCLLPSVETICSFSSKPTRSMRVICQVKYCSFLLFHLTLLHWGYDNISTTSCQHPSGHPALLWVIISEWLAHILSPQMIRRKKWDYNITCGANSLWLFGVDLVKMKSPPSVCFQLSMHAAICYCSAHIFVRNMSF